uniref:PH domain-containing protein n=1 Tax=Nothobranchius furzeri TaxID=105023 RepID=A0A8C6PY06_NOTFU
AFLTNSGYLLCGFLFKQWKKRFLRLTAEGGLIVCHDALSAPDQIVLLQSSCEAIVEGKEILDLPKLPSGAFRDCCFALILPQNKYMLLLAETPADCRSAGHCPLLINIDYFFYTF